MTEKLAQKILRTYPRRMQELRRRKKNIGKLNKLRNLRRQAVVMLVTLKLTS